MLELSEQLDKKPGQLSGGQQQRVAMGDRVAVLKDGYLQQIDTPQNLYDRPVNVFVAAFIGSPSMNLYEAELRDGRIQLGSHQLALPQSVFERRPALQGYNGRRVVAGVRSEDFEDALLAASAPSGTTITSPVELTESLGSEIVAHFKLDATRVDPGNPDAAHNIRGSAVARFDPRGSCRAGEPIDIAVTVDNFHFFDIDDHTAIWD